MLRAEPLPRRELQAPPAPLHRGEAGATPRGACARRSRVLNLAEPDEERFYRRHRADNAAPAQAALGEEDWVDASRTRTSTRS